MEPVLLLSSPPQTMETVWGDGVLARRYHAEIAPGVDPNRVAFAGGFGEAGRIRSGGFAGETLGWLYGTHPEYFGTPQERRWPERLPVGAAMGQAAGNHSLHVHPREDWAQEHLHDHGKSECWYILDCPADAQVILGHRARTPEELDGYIARGDWEGLMIRRPVHPGDFFAVKAGELHSVQAGTTFVSVSNPNPVTYRFYDWDRMGSDGRPRPVQIPQARENILVPHQEIVFPPIVSRYGGVLETWLANNEDCSVWLYQVEGRGVLPRKKPFVGGLMIAGEGAVNGMPLTPITPFLVTRGCREFVLEGSMTILGFHG